MMMILYHLHGALCSWGTRILPLPLHSKDECPPVHKTDLSDTSPITIPLNCVCVCDDNTGAK